MSLLQNSNAISSGGYDLTNSLRFRASASAYLNRTFGTPTNNKIFTWSAWIKLGTIPSSREGFLVGSNGIGSYFALEFNASAGLSLWDSNTSTAAAILVTTQVFRDPSAWYHIVLAVDTTQATAANRIKLYVNGSQVTALSTATYPAQNSNPYMNSSSSIHNICNWTGTSLYLDGYLAEINFVDGQALTPSSFGETDPVTGSWVAKKYTGTYGINGFYLPFSDTDSNENLSLGSQTIGGSYWSNVNVTATVNNTAAPDGTTTASRLQATVADSLSLQGLTNFFVGQTYTWSVYLRADSTTSISLLVDKNGAGGAGYETLPITVTTSWQRFSLTFIPASTTPALLLGGGGTFSSPEVVYAWGSQVNTGSIAKKYIVTTASQVTNQGTIENLLTYSEDLTNAAWDKTGNVTVTGNTLVAPNGSTTADTLFETAVNNEHYLQRTLTPATNTQYVFSTYVKYLNRKYIGLRIVYGNGAQDTLAIFDIQNGTYYGYDGSAPTATSITSVGNGWYRISATFTTPATNPFGSLLFRHQFRDNSLMGNYAGNASVGMYLWGAQIETQGTLGPYLPTVASAQSLVNRIGTDRSLGSTGFGYNTWIPNNISLTLGTTYDAMIDVPTNTSATVANYAVLNPVYKSAIQPTISNGNLTVAPNTANYQNAFSSIGVTSGKWYCEVVVTGTPNSANMIGVANATQLNYLTGTASYIGINVGVGYGYFIFNGQKYTNNAGTSYGNTIASGDIVGIALDLDNGKIWFSKNGTWQASGDPAAGTNAAFTGIASDTWSIGSTSYSGGVTSFNHNFGQRPFSYTPPTGFKSLNTFNLPNSTILKGSRFMEATTYTGNGATQSITNATSFKPDFVWGKRRDAAGNHNLYDSIRGVTNFLTSNATSAEIPGVSGVTSFNSNGFSVGSHPDMNTNAGTFVGWQWQAGQGTTSTITDGTISSTVSVNATAGFSIATYTGVNNNAGATVGHGLGVAPDFVIIKRRDSTGNWIAALNTNGGGIANYRLNTTDAAFNTFVPIDNNSGMTPANVLVLSYTGGGNAADMLNNVGATYVMYSWAEIPGYSKFGRYTGNGSTDGPFVYLGFRPKFILLKNSSAANNWVMYDTSRNTFNVMPNILYANLTNAEAGGNAIVDALSNGFKLRNTFADHNGNGNTIAYAAFAENPFKNSNAR
jgi:hypothetical protein